MLKRHKLIYAALIGPVRLFLRIKFGYKFKKIRSKDLPEKYIVLYMGHNDNESLKDANGDSIDYSKSLLDMQMIYNMPGLSEKHRQALFEAFGVSEKVRHYNKTLVNDKLAEMKRKAK